MTFPLKLCLALLLDAVLGDPLNIPHPAALIGRAVNFFRKIFFTSTHSFIRGLAVCISTLLTTSLAVFLMLYLSGCNIIVQVYLLYSAIAWRDLKDETAPVLACLMAHDIKGARKYLSRVVGRDTDILNETEITRAVIETIAENSIDGIISVIFFAALGQALNPHYGAELCVWLFKASSTLDSMIGYEDLHEFGKASARLDDVMNFLPARLGGVIIVIAGGRGFSVFTTDRLKHKSPNSAHGESAFAGVLGIRLGGGAYYGGKFEAREYINAEGREAVPYDIVRAWRLLDASCALFACLVILLTWKI